MASDMVYSLVILQEDGEERECIVPACWVKGNTVYYPHGLHVKKYHRNCTPPERNWDRYTLVKVKMTGMFGSLTFFFTSQCTVKLKVL